MKALISVLSVAALAVITVSPTAAQTPDTTQSYCVTFTHDAQTDLTIGPASGLLDSLTNGTVTVTLIQDPAACAQTTTTPLVAAISYETWNDHVLGRYKALGRLIRAAGRDHMTLQQQRTAMVHIRDWAKSEQVALRAMNPATCFRNEYDAWKTNVDKIARGGQTIIGSIDRLSLSQMKAGMRVLGAGVKGVTHVTDMYDESCESFSTTSA